MQWLVGVILVPLTIVFVSSTWEANGSAARDMESRHFSDIEQVRRDNDRQTDRLSELGKLNAETAARLEALGERQSRVEQRLDEVEKKSWSLGGRK